MKPEKLEHTIRVTATDRPVRETVQDTWRHSPAQLRNQDAEPVQWVSKVVRRQCETARSKDCNVSIS